MITVLATIFTAPEDAEIMNQILLNMASSSIHEKACLKFEVLQNIDNHCHFVLNEQWKSMEGFQAHFETEHFKRISPELFKKAIKHPETIVYKTKE